MRIIQKFKRTWTKWQTLQVDSHEITKTIGASLSVIIKAMTILSKLSLTFKSASLIKIKGKNVMARIKKLILQTSKRPIVKLTIIRLWCTQELQIYSWTWIPTSRAPIWKLLETGIWKMQVPSLQKALVILMIAITRVAPPLVEKMTYLIFHHLVTKCSISRGPVLLSK